MAGDPRAALLTLHLACVALSVAGFLLRGWWLWRDSPRLAAKPVRILPHVVDTALLLSGVALAWLGAIYPWQQPWLAAKLLALVLYVVLGSLALKRASAPAFVAALLVVCYMIGAAWQRSSWSWLA